VANVNHKQKEVEKDPEQSALEKQLVELNNRSRWYSTQLWTVPLSYFGISAVIITNLFKDGREFLGASFSASAIIGIFVIWHMQGIRNGEKRAVENLKNIEKKLRLPPTAEYKHYTIPFYNAVWIAVLGFYLIGIFLFLKKIL